MLVDDGSNDAETAKICEHLAGLFDNVFYHTFADSGSGSASRPRNFGIQNCQTELITFLDPDNEISPHGYDALIQHYDSLRMSGVDTEFVGGFQVKVSDTLRTTGKHAESEPVVVDNAIESFFARGKFPVVTTQAAVLDSRMLRDNNIFFVEGAVGQDTLFGWEVLLNAHNPVFVDDAYLIYYAERSGSVTNSVDSRYFEKSLKLESKQVATLRKLNVLDYYVDHHLRNFFQNWYLPKLNELEVDEQRASRVYLEEISNLYGLTLADFE